MLVGTSENMAIKKKSAKEAERILVLCNKSSWNNFGVKAAEIADRKLLRIALIRSSLRSLRSTISASFHARNYLKNFCYRALVLLSMGMCFGSSLYAADKIEVGVSYFFPQSESVRKIYGGGVNYHLTLTQNFTTNWDLWSGFNYFSKSGHSLHDHQKTTIKIIPFSLGVLRLFPFCVGDRAIDLYVKGGLKYYFVKIHNHSSFVESHTNKNGLGGVFGIGSYFQAVKGFYFNTFVDYSFKRFHSIHHKHHAKSYPLEVGGLDFGGGIVYQF